VSVYVLLLLQCKQRQHLELLARARDASWLRHGACNTLVAHINKCQYLYFCTSKASKVSRSGCKTEARAGSFRTYCRYACTYIYVRTHTHTQTACGGLVSHILPLRVRNFRQRGPQDFVLQRLKREKKALRCPSVSACLGIYMNRSAESGT